MTTIFNVVRTPDTVAIQPEGRPLQGAEGRGKEWHWGEVAVAAGVTDSQLAIAITAETEAISAVRLRWNGAAPAKVRVLNDHWERGYGDLEWRGLVPERVLPWYFLATTGDQHWGCGVKTAPGAFCSWQVDAEGVTLWLDIRCGGSGVVLKGRTLAAATVVSRTEEGGNAFSFAQSFCHDLCDNPRLPDHAVYGSNNWYYAYGKSSHEAILEDTRIASDYATHGRNRPYMVIDAGWQKHALATFCTCGGPWTEGNEAFPDMAGLAQAMADLGARPGIWTRPFAAPPEAQEAHLLPLTRVVDESARVAVYDPSLPEVLEQIEADMRCLSTWGYQLIKHDWTSCDVFGRWGFQMGREMTLPGWAFADRGRTTAEIMRDAYAAIRRGAGSSVVIGCNTISHLSAGLFELQRTGDDTSGREWERTRKMGINTLAFRMAQHDAFYAVDADCVGITDKVPWEFNRQWLDLLARSGTPLFVSADPAVMGPEQKDALTTAFAIAAEPPAVGEPLDWLETTCPRHWRLAGEEVTYHWIDTAKIQR